MMWLLLLACGPEPAVVVQGMSSQNPAVREDMVTLARKVEGEEVVEALMVLLEDPAPAIRVRAIEALAEQGVVEAAPAIAERVEDRDPDVQTAAIEALGRLKDPAGVEALMAIAEREARVDAIWALGAIGDARALPLLSRMAGYNNEYVAWNAEVALRAIGDGAVSEEEAEEAPEEEAPAEEEEPEPVEAPPPDIKQRDEKPRDRKVSWPPGG